MTRETKVGVVVAGSFLCLVGVVVASKLRGGAAANDNPPVAQGIVPKGDDKGKGAPKAPGVLPTSLEEQSVRDNPPPKGPTIPPALPPAGPKEGNPPSVTPPPVGPPAGNPPDEEEERFRRLLASNLPKSGPPGKDNPPVVPPAADPKFRFPDLADNKNPPGNPPKDVLPPAADLIKFDPVGPPPVIPPADAPKKDTLPLLPPAGNPPPVAKKDTLPPVGPPPVGPPPVSAPTFEKKETLPPPVGNPPPVGGAKDALPPVGPPPVGNPPPLGGAKDTLPPVGPPPVGPPKDDPAITLIPRKDTVSRPFDANPPKDGNPPALNPPKDEMRLNPPAFTAQPKDGNPPPLGADRLNPTPPLETRPITPPSGGNFGNPPPGNPSVGGLPRVTSFDVETYQARQDDVSFGSVSQRVYGSDKYAAALLQYNREHALARENIRQEPPRLSAGTPLYIPPADWLQSKYPNLVARTGSVAAPPLGANNNPPATTPPVRITPPVGSPMAGSFNPTFTPANPNAQPSAPAGDPVKRYMVRGQSQHIIEIARQTLGDGNRWAEIYRLNPSIQPQQPIPGGTELRLPEYARVQ